MYRDKFTVVAESHNQHPVGYVRVLDLLIQDRQDTYFRLRIQTKADRMREEHQAAAKGRQPSDQKTWLVDDEPITKETVRQILLSKRVINSLVKLDTDPEAPIIPLSDYMQTADFTDQDAGA